MSTDTLGNKIKAKAVKEFEEELNDAASAFIKLLCKHAYGIPEVRLETPNPIASRSSTHLMKEIVAAAVKKSKDKISERAIKDFMNQVESLQEQLDELG